MEIEPEESAAKRFLTRTLPAAVLVFCASILFESAAFAAPGLTVGVESGDPMDAVSGKASGFADFAELRVVVFVRTDKWYPQPDQANFYLEPDTDGSYRTSVHSWKQIAAFVIGKDFDAWNGHRPHDLFPLEVDGTDILAVGFHPSVLFAGHRWAVKAGERLQPGGPFPPGAEQSDGCDYSAGDESVRVDEQGRLRLKMIQTESGWSCAEVYLPRPLGFGHYHFLIESRVDQLDKNLVASPFLYHDPENELDIEFSRWGDPEARNAQFVVQPYYVNGNRQRFDMDLSDEKSTHVISWKADEAVFVSARGHHGAIPAEAEIETWTTTSEDVPEQAEMKPHINLWMFRSEGPSDENAAEMIVKDFAYCETVCEPPESGDWNVTESCTLLDDALLSGDLVVSENAGLDFALGAFANMDWTGHKIVVQGLLTIGAKGGIR